MTLLQESDVGTRLGGYWWEGGVNAEKSPDEIRTLNDKMIVLRELRRKQREDRYTLVRTRVELWCHLYVTGCAVVKDMAADGLPQRKTAAILGLHIRLKTGAR